MEHWQYIHDFFTSGPGVLLGSVFALIAVVHRKYLNDEWNLSGSPGDGAFKRRIEQLRQCSIAENYRQQLKRLMAWVDRWFGPVGETADGSWQARWLGCQPWTGLAFGRLLWLAVFYPIFFLLLSWWLTNKGNIGALEILPSADLWRRSLTIIAWIPVGFALYRFNKTRGWQTWAWVTIALALALIGAVGVAGALGGAGAGAAATAFVGVIAIAGAFGAALTVAFAGAGAVAVTGAGTGAVGACIGIGIGIALLFDSSQSKTVHKGRLGRFWIGGWILLNLYLMLTAVIIVFWGDPETLFDAFTILLFLGILPLANVPLDWVSFGVTRGLLHAIAEGHHSAPLSLFFGVLDLILALLFLLLVGLSTMGGIWLVNAIAVWGGSTPVVDLPALWRQLHTGGWRENLWIWAMLGSTLIPTFIHFVVAMFAVALLFPQHKAKWAADRMEKSLKENEALKKAGKPTDNVIVDHDARRIAVLYISLAKLGVLVVATVLLIVLGGLFFLHLPGFIDAILPGTDIVAGATGG